MQDQGVELRSLMCKKIADLVKVVDKLFRSSHAAQLENVFLREELVEFEALRKENETLNEKLDALQRKLREAQEKFEYECEKLKELHRLEMDKLREEMNCREEEFLDKLREKDHALSDMEHQLGLKTVQNKELQGSLSECRKRYKMASSSSRDAKEENDGLFSELVAVKSSMESMEEELEAMRLEKDGLKRELEQHGERAGWEGEKCKLHKEIASLQEQVKKLQSQLLRMAHGSHASHASHEPSRSAHKGRVVGSGSVMGKDAMLELERLRQEVSWYRLELMNREGNFNRMFAPHLPVNVAEPGSAASQCSMSTDSGGSVYRRAVGQPLWDERKSVPLPKLEPKDSILKRTKSLQISKRTAVFTARH